MRTLLLAFLVLSACNGKSTKDTDTDVDTDTVVVMEDPCDVCDRHAECKIKDDVAECTCDDGYEGNGKSCDQIEPADACAVDNGGCDIHATCTPVEADDTDAASDTDTNAERTCACNSGYDGDGLTCTLELDESLRACAYVQAEHPSYTTIARDVALCGNRYDEDNLETACHTGWHVCQESQWTARYPIRLYRASPTDPDLIGPTLGPLTSWGAVQADRCAGDVWEAYRPTDDRTSDESVCHDPDASIQSYTGGAYNPWNGLKVLFADDGTTILSGLDEAGNTNNCCDWDVEFEPALSQDAYAVYCCKD